ncbi:MAG: carboxypeptidase regulatory-like domain-containing protein [Vicinamibacterales bacterium]
MRIREVFLACVTAGAVGMVSLTGAQSGTVTGTVTAKGLRTSADIVVSLQAPGLTVTTPKKPVEMDQKGMLFLPHVLPVVRGTTVRFQNSDPTPHNVFSPEGKFNLGTWPQGETRDHTFDKPGVYTQLCRVHPEMEGYVVVLETPYFAVTDKAGRFEITDVPAGKYTMGTWSEKLKGTPQTVTVETGKTATVNVVLGR